MNNADESTTNPNTLPDDSDLGPEPEWLIDDEVTDLPSDAPNPPAEAPVDDTILAEVMPPAEPAQQPPTEAIVERERPTEFAADPVAAAATPVVRPDRPWLFGAVGLLLLLATALVAWFGSTQGLNNTGTWEAIRNDRPALLPARWAMLIWWAVVPLLAVFFVYGMLPAGRAITRIKLSGPLLSLGLVGVGLWIFAQHWNWNVVGLLSIGIATIAVFVTYLFVALGPGVQNLRQRLLAVAPLSAALGFGLMLTALSWQSYSSQPFGVRGSSVLFTLLLVMIAAVFAFFLRDGLFGLVLAIWFAGVVHQQWGEDAVISLIAAVAVLLSGGLAVLGTILATESPRPSLTTKVENRRRGISFFRKTENTASE